MRRYGVYLYSAFFVIICFVVIISCTKEKPGETSLVVSPLEIEFEAGGGSSVIHITCDSQWEISNTSEWCTISKMAAKGSDSVEVTVIANEDKISRSITISITSEDIIKEILISQKKLILNDTIPEFTYDIPPDSTDMRQITCIDLAKEMKVGWNVGNSLEAIGGETAWGNPLISKTLIDSVKAAGFNAIRIPVAWSKFSNASSFTIQTTWLNRVEEVVNYVLDNGMYAIVNLHWDGGWMQPTYAQQEYVNNRLSVMWKQIATHFRDYNDYLLFAGSNEVMVTGNYGTPTREYYTVQNSFNQTFVTTVRATGGRNAYRHLVVQGFNTNINYTVSYAVMPNDKVEDRLMMEVHYYDPYNFTLNENSSISQWGKIATNPSLTETWANESYADGQFQKMKTKFIDKGIPVILGEYGVISRTEVNGSETFRTYYMEYITQSIVDHGLIPFYWDNGYAGNHSMAIYNRTNGGKLYPDIVEAITSAVK